MPSFGRVQLNLSVEPEIKESLRKHCEAAGLSFAQAITEYVKACDREGRLLISNIPNAIPNIDLDSIVTFDQLPSALDSYYSQSHNELATKDYVQQAINNLKEELKVITPDIDELPTITQVDSKSLAPLFDDVEREEKESDHNKLRMTELKEFEIGEKQALELLNDDEWLTMKQLKEKTGLSPGTIRARISQERKKLDNRKLSNPFPDITIKIKNYEISTKKEGDKSFYKIVNVE